MKFVDRISIGTANFLNNYGISKSCVGYDELDKILTYCYDLGISRFDTASRYGPIEHYLLNNLPKGMKINTKVEYKDLQTFSSDLDRLLQFDIECIYLHNFDYFLTSGNGKHIYELKSLLKEFRKNSLLGASIYTIAEFQAAIELGFDVIQIPFNVLEGRFTYLRRVARQKNIKIVGRSIFLQGVLLKKDALSLFKGNGIEKYQQVICDLEHTTGFSRLDLLITKAISDLSVDEIIFGISSVQQLRKIIQSINLNIQIHQECFEELHKLEIMDEQILNPRNWNV